MTRSIRSGPPVAKSPRGNPAHDHSPDDRRHHHPRAKDGMDAARAEEKHHHKR